MAKQTKKKKNNPKTEKLRSVPSALKLEVTCIVLICISVILIASVFFKAGGSLGGFISAFLKGFLGIGAYILPLISICFCVFIFISKDKKINIFKFVVSIITFSAILALFHILSKDESISFSSYIQYLVNEYQTATFFDGGVLGAIFGDILLTTLGSFTAVLLLIVIIIACFILLAEKSFIDATKAFFKKLSTYFYFEYKAQNQNSDYDKSQEDEDEEELYIENEQEEYSNFEEDNKISLFEILKLKLLDTLKEDTNAKNNKMQIREDANAKNNKIEIKEDDNTKNNKIEIKDDIIFDGKDKYVKIPNPTFLNMNNMHTNNENYDIELAINEIKNFESKHTENYKKIESIEFNKPRRPPIDFDYEDGLNTKKDYIPFNYKYNKIKNNLSNSNVYNTNNNTKYTEGYNTNTDIEYIEEHDINNNTEYEEEHDINNNTDIEEHDINNDTKHEVEHNTNNNTRYTSNNIKILKKQDFTRYNLGQTVYSIDFDIPSRKEIEDLFAIPPEEILPENIDLEYLDRLEDFYNFEENASLEHNIEHKLEYNHEYNQDHKQDYKDYKQEYNQAHNQNINLNKTENKVYKPASNIQNNNKDNELLNNATDPIIIRPEKEKILNESIIKQEKEYQFPKLSFLNKNLNKNNFQNDLELKENSKILVKTLKSFNVNSQVINISKGPSVTRYELSIEDGIKVSKILGLSDNLALSLAANSIRIEAPIPGKSAVGIEIPNKEITSVYLSEVICSEKFQKFPSKLSFGIGKDITGNVIVTDIAKMPHILIAGSTGSGKSVCVNTLITSIIYKASPKEVKLMMIDPKVVELSVYNGIPHLLTPVVTEPEKAAGVLNWAVSEMMERYNLFAQTKTRNLEGYNLLKIENNEPKLPQIVIIIDELADLMMVAAKEVEASICRLAQLARAAGIHLIIATQRPSVDVITGLIKANIPSRIAFAVSSGTDSRTIIDSVGAEKLLGKGDMLFKAVDMNKPLRIQGAFISDKEVETIVNFIKETNPADYDENIINKIEKASKFDNSSNGEGSDELTEDIIGFLVNKGKASTSLIQRQFRIGYNRAARIMEELEDRGIISSENGSKQREVLMDKYQYEEYLNRNKNY